MSISVNPYQTAPSEFTMFDQVLFLNIKGKNDNFNHLLWNIGMITLIEHKC